MLRIKAYLTRRGLHDFGFFMVPRFGPTRGDSSASAVPPRSAAEATAPPGESDTGPAVGASAGGLGETAAVAVPVGETADITAGGVCKLFVRGFRANPPEAAREDILRAVRGAGLASCMPEYIELLSDRCGVDMQVWRSANGCGQVWNTAVYCMPQPVVVVVPVAIGPSRAVDGDGS